MKVFFIPPDTPASNPSSRPVVPLRVADARANLVSTVTHGKQYADSASRNLCRGIYTL